MQSYGVLRSDITLEIPIFIINFDYYALGIIGYKHLKI